MRVAIFGASGMVGQGVLLECLRDPAVERVVVVGRSSAGRQDAKLEEHVLADLFNVAAYADRLEPLDACFFCLGVSSTGMSEATYRHLTYDLTLAIARVLAARNPAMCFFYVSGSGTDSTERGRMMWARVKGATENALLAPAVPGWLHGATRLHAAAGRHRVEDALLPFLLRPADSFGTAAAIVAKCVPQLHHHHAGTGARHAACRAVGMAATNPGDGGHRPRRQE